MSKGKHGLSVTIVAVTVVAVTVCLSAFASGAFWYFLVNALAKTRGASGIALPYVWATAIGVVPLAFRIAMPLFPLTTVLGTTMVCVWAVRCV